MTWLAIVCNSCEAQWQTKRERFIVIDCKQLCPVHNPIVLTLLLLPLLHCLGRLWGLKWCASAVKERHCLRHCQRSAVSMLLFSSASSYRVCLAAPRLRSDAQPIQAVVEDCSTGFDGPAAREQAACPTSRLESGGRTHSGPHRPQSALLSAARIVVVVTMEVGCCFPDLTLKGPSVCVRE